MATSDSIPSGGEGKRRIVEAAYDEIAQNYHKWASTKPSPRTTYIDKLIPLLPPNANILELGCGAGVPSSHILGSDGRKVIGVDISESMVVLAKKLLNESPSNPKPNVEFVKSDIMQLDYGKETFDAVVGFYSLIHLPRDDQVVLLERISGWLKPGGYILFNLTGFDLPDLIQKGWCGAKNETENYWSGYDAATNRKTVEEKGFEVVEGDVVTEQEDGVDVAFFWVLAKKK